MATTESRTAVDHALAEFHRYRAEYGGGLSSHGPMVVESLEHAGLEEHVSGWTTSYVSRLEPAEPAAPRLEARLRPGKDAPEAWSASFATELAHRAWPEVVAAWAPTLVPGSVGAAGHGILRAAHAVRSLGRRESPERLAELAHGLGYWAASSFVLPGREASGTSTLSEALDRVPLTQSSAFLISERVADIDGRAFGPAVAAAALPGDADDALTAVVDLALRVLLANPDSAIAFIHAVTVPCCARHLLPFVDEAGGLAVANQAWWVLAALWSAYGRNPPVVDAPTEAPEWADLVAAALRNGDEHAIKFTVAAQDQIDRVDELLLRSAVARVVTAG